MAGSGQGVVTAHGVRDGDPRALAALAAVRGTAVLAFCEQVCDPASAVVATADAFARFRSAVYAAPRIDAINPDALLLERTRAAAAEHALPAPTATGLRERMARRRSSACASVPLLLAARASKQLSDADRERLARHLSRCSGCRVIENRFRDAERAYRRAKPGSLPPAVAERIVSALAAAAPVAPESAESPALDAGPSSAAHGGAGASPGGNGDSPHHSTALEHIPPDDPQPDYGEEPTGDFPAAVEPEGPSVEPGEPAAELDEPGVEAGEPAFELDEPGVEAGEPAFEYGEPAGYEPDPAYGDPDPTGIFPVPERRVGEPATIAFAAGAARRARGALLRPGATRRRTTRPDRSHRHQRRGGFATRIVAPAAIVIAGVVAALAAAGVFNSKPHSAHRAAASVATTVPPAAAATQPAAPKKHHHHRRRHRHHRARAHHVAARRHVTATATVPRTTSPTTTPTQQVASTAPPARRHATSPSSPPASAHVIGGPTSQAPPQTGAPSGTAPAGYQPSP